MLYIKLFQNLTRINKIKKYIITVQVKEIFQQKLYAKI